MKYPITDPKDLDYRIQSINEAEGTIEYVNSSGNIVTEKYISKGKSYALVLDKNDGYLRLWFGLALD